MLALLRQRRWAGLLVVVLILMGTFIRLGVWQLHRLHERRALNAIITTNRSLPAAPAESVLSAMGVAQPTEQWRVLTAVGTYDLAHQLLWRSRTLNGQPGLEVLTPLLLSDGAALYVDRGWVPVAATAVALPDVPAPPAGTVTVTGRLRVSVPTPAGRPAPPSGETIAPDIPALRAATGLRLLGGYVELTAQQPAAGDSPTLLPEADVSEGPHLSYAVQWFTFTVVAAVGFVLLLRREAATASREDTPAREA